MPLGFLAIMYLFIIRPQQKKAKDQAALINQLKVGDEVVTAGGIIGRLSPSHLNSFLSSCLVTRLPKFLNRQSRALRKTRPGAVARRSLVIEF